MIEGSFPRVTMVVLTTLCGRIGPGIRGSALDRRRLEEARAATDASLMGAGTLREGDPRMLGPGGAHLANRLRAVITSSGAIPLEGKALFEDGPAPVVFTGEDGRKDIETRLGGRARVEIIPKGPFGLSVRAACLALLSFGARSVLIEGGGQLNYAALAEGVVDEMLLTLSPRVSGGIGAPSLADGPLSLYNLPIRIRLAEALPQETGEVFLRYQVERI